MKKEATLSVTIQNDEVIVRNSMGWERRFKDMSEETAIACIVFDTLLREFNKKRIFHDYFTIKVTLEDDL